MWPFFSRKARRTAPTRHRSPTRRPLVETLEDRFLFNAGYLDPTFGAAGAGIVQPGAGSVHIQPNGQILGLSGSVLTRCNADGSLDTSFGSGGTAQVNFGAGWTARLGGEALQPDGKILISGVVYPPNATTGLYFGVARFNSDRSPDTTCCSSPTPRRPG